MDDNTIEHVEIKSRGQHGNPVYDSYREERLTASMFGKICKRFPYTSCHSHVKECLETNFLDGVTSIRYGKEHEEEAIQTFQSLSKKTVRQCGLYIDKKINYLAASPDGMYTFITLSSERK